MTAILKPDKEAVRAWLLRRRSGHEQLPTSERIRAELGWRLGPAPVTRAGRKER